VAVGAARSVPMQAVMFVRDMHKQRGHVMQCPRFYDRHVGVAPAVAATPCPEAATRCAQAVLFGLASTQALVAAGAEALARGVPALQGRAAVLPLVGPVPAPVLAALPAGIAVTCAWGGLQVPPRQRAAPVAPAT
jgi:hypothetical protein